MELCVYFNYERLPSCCFICGKLDHEDRFCVRTYDTPNDTMEKAYSPWMCAPNSLEVLVGETLIQGNGKGKDIVGSAMAMIKE
ncbi:Zinc knuckle CX2CX4HX4C [Dillenia turbinata]|uniref:Zinc knuckle CX2CX4HX4C n=1 Tax=Dillenia turbinata TaxID=194707 RepID=A0AAN8VCR5_9MAGN